MSEQPPPPGGWHAPDEPKPWDLPGTDPASPPTDPAPPPTDATSPRPELQDLRGTSDPAGRTPGWGPVTGPAYTQTFGPAYDQTYGQATGAPHGVGPGGSWRAPPKPGVVPLRPLGLGELLDGAVQTLRHNPRVMLGLSAAVMAVVGALSTGFMVAGLPRLLSVVATPRDQVDSTQIAGALGGGVAGFLVPALLQGLAVVVLSGVLIVAVSEAVLGRRPTVGQVWARARSRVPALIGLSLLTGLLTVLGMVVLVGPGLALLAVSGPAAAIALALGVPAAFVLAALLYVRLAFAAPALLLEDLSVVAALRRSWRLVSGSWWRVLGVLVLTGIIASIVGALLQTPFSILGTVIAAAVSGGSAGTTAQVTPALVITSAVGNLGTIVASTITAPFSAAVTALLYIDLRMRREGLDVALARAAQG